MYPAFGDVDGDGDMDMMIGDLQGRLHFFRNESTTAEAEFQLVQPNVTDASGGIIDVGQFATPQFMDMDGDGLLDLIIGERNGNLNYYQNTGTVQVPAWTLVTEDLGGVNTTEYWNITGYSTPFMFRNAAGDREILLGSESGWLYHYGDIEGNLEGTWTLLDSTFMDLREGIRTGVCLHDFTGDGELDMVVGNYRGGLSFWRSDEATGVGIVTAPELPAFHMAPNPATGTVQLLHPGNGPVTGHWVFRNGLGQETLRHAVQGERTEVALGSLAEGIYLVRLEGSMTTATQRLVVLRGDR
jgi:hypothetical protein